MVKISYETVGLSLIVSILFQVLLEDKWWIVELSAQDDTIDNTDK